VFFEGRDRVKVRVLARAGGESLVGVEKIMGHEQKNLCTFHFAAILTIRAIETWLTPTFFRLSGPQFQRIKA
jgi:hypothetical protein